jgi:hypothetical protein
MESLIPGARFLCHWGGEKLSDCAMKKAGLLLLICFLTASSQGQISLFQNSFGTNLPDRMVNLFPGPHHGFIASGENFAGHTEYTLSGLDSAGMLLWTKQYSFDSAGFQVSFLKAYPCTDRGLLLNANEAPYGYSTLSRTDAAGQIRWTKGFTGDLGMLSLVQSSDGDFLFTGSGNVGGLSTGKIDTSGNILWVKQFIPSGTNGSSTQVTGMAIAESMVDSSLLVAARIIYPYGMVIVKYDKVGNMLWSDSVSVAGYTSPAYKNGVNTDIHLFTKANGNSLLFFNSLTPFIVELSKTGNVLWSKSYSLPGLSNQQFYLFDASYTDSGILLAGSYLNNNNNTTYDEILFKTDTAGNVLWTNSFGGPRDDRAFCLVRTSDKGILVGGTTDNFSSHQGDMYLVKTDSNGIPNCNHLPTPVLTAVNGQLTTSPCPGANNPQIPVVAQAILSAHPFLYTQAGTCACTNPPQAGFFFDGWHQFIDTSVWATTWKYTYSDGGKDTAIMDPYHNFPHNGKFYACLTVTNACGTSTACDSVYNGPFPVSVPALSVPALACKIFPNPTIGKTNILFSRELTEPVKAEVYDLFGQPVFDSIFKDQQQEVDLSFLPRGIYFILFHSGETIFSAKLMVL